MPSAMQRLERRCQRLLAWLGRHQAQLQLQGDDLPEDLQRALAGRLSASSNFHESELLTLLKPTAANILEQHSGALVSLSLWLPDPPAAAEGQDEPDAPDSTIPLEGHTSLSRLQLRNFRGNAADLAALLQPAPQLECVELQLNGDTMHPQLLAGVQGQSELSRLLTGLTSELTYSFDEKPAPGIPEGLAACTALTSLDLALLSNTWGTNPAASAELPSSVSNLR